MCCDRVTQYGQSMFAELSKLHGSNLTPGDFSRLIEFSLDYPAEILRLIRESEAHPDVLLAIMRKLTSERIPCGDPFVDKELLRRRCCAYKWCVRAMRAWHLRALRREADVAHAAGKWFSGAGRTGRRIKVLGHLGLLTWAGIQLRMGMIVDVDDVARDLVDMTASYFTA